MSTHGIHISSNTVVLKYSKVFSIKCLPQYFFPSKRDIKGFIALPSIYIYIADKNRQYYEYINNSNLELKYIEKAT